MRFSVALTGGVRYSFYVIKKIVIVGGGFGGIRAALDLCKAALPGAHITLISDKPHFEYHAALYRLVAGRTPLEVCVPLKEIFSAHQIELFMDEAASADFNSRVVRSKKGAEFKYDFLILALGSETSYFNIPGLAQLSYGFKSITEALNLKEHLHQILEIGDQKDIAEKLKSARIVVVGGGASGVEIAGELASYVKKLAKMHGFDPTMLAIDLIEGTPRLVPNLPGTFSEKLKSRLHRLGINIYLNRTVLSEDVEQIYLRDMQLKTKTVIWTAGIKPHHFFETLTLAPKDNKGRMAVNEYLEIPKYPGVFVIGDAAATPYSGMAQTAIHDGAYIAGSIKNRILGRRIAPYKPKKPFYAIPAGSGWAGVVMGPFRFYGRIGWWLRRLADFRFFLSILPLTKAILAFRNEKTICESCLICAPKGGEA